MYLTDEMWGVASAMPGATLSQVVDAAADSGVSVETILSDVIKRVELAAAFAELVALQRELCQGRWEGLTETIARNWQAPGSGGVLGVICQVRDDIGTAFASDWRGRRAAQERRRDAMLEMARRYAAENSWWRASERPADN